MQLYDAISLRSMLSFSSRSYVPINTQMIPLYQGIKENKHKPLQREDYERPIGKYGMSD